MPRTPLAALGALFFLLLLLGTIALGIYATANGQWGLLIAAVVGSWVCGIVGSLFSIQILGFVQFLTLIYWAGDVILGIYALRSGQTGLLITTVVAFFVIPFVGGWIMNLKQNMQREIMAAWLGRQEP